MTVQGFHCYTLFLKSYRPIVSGVNSIYQPLAKYVDGYLKNIVSSLPRCLKDTGDFLSKIGVNLSRRGYNIPLYPRHEEPLY